MLIEQLIADLDETIELAHVGSNVGGFPCIVTGLVGLILPELDSNAGNA